MPKPNNLRIIIPTFNGECSIGKTILRLSQEIEHHPNISLLVIPNGCEDGTKDVLKKIAKDYKFDTLNLPRPSKTNAMNQGADLSKGYKYIAFMDDDCFVKIDDILACVSVLNKNKYLNAVALQPKGMITSKNILGRLLQHIFSQASEYQFLKHPKKYMVGRFMVFKRKNWKKIPNYIICDDAWLTRIHWPNIKILSNNHICYVPSSSLTEWWKRYSRNVASLEQMKMLFPEFRLKIVLKPKINWRALFNPLNLPNSMFFAIYRIIRKLNKCYYKRCFRNNKNKVFWHRDKTAIHSF